jgi:hypothetical protein
MRIVSFNRKPFAYAYDYEVNAWPQPQLARLPRTSRVIDSFIGWPSMIGEAMGERISNCSRNRSAPKARRWLRSIRRKTSSGAARYKKRPSA